MLTALVFATLGNQALWGLLCYRKDSKKYLAYMIKYEGGSGGVEDREHHHRNPKFLNTKEDKGGITNVIFQHATAHLLPSQMKKKKKKQIFHWFSWIFGSACQLHRWKNITDSSSIRTRDIEWRLWHRTQFLQKPNSISRGEQIWVVLWKAA